MAREREQPLIDIKPTKFRSEARKAEAERREAHRQRRANVIGIKPAITRQLPDYELPYTDKHGTVHKPLIAAIEAIILWGGRVPECYPLMAVYNVSKPTINNVIRRVKDEWLEKMAKTRQSRQAKNARRLDTIVDVAFKSGDARLAKDAIMDMSKLIGDMAPETHIMLGGDKDPEALLKQADELRALALAPDKSDD